jgi:mRNA interferase HicA
VALGLLDPYGRSSRARFLADIQDGIANRTEVFDNRNVKGSEFLRKVRTVARRNKVPCRWAPERGSGSHGTLYFGDRLTVVKDLKKELGPGLLADMLKQLGVRKEEL